MQRFITTAGFLLGLVVVVTTQSAHAQGGPGTASGDQKSVTSTSQSDEPLPVAVSNTQVLPSSLGQNPWFSRVGLLVVPYHSSAIIATNGKIVSGGTAKASNNMTVTFDVVDVGYEVTKNIAASVTLGVPPEASYHGGRRGG